MLYTEVMLCMCVALYVAKITSPAESLRLHQHNSPPSSTTALVLLLNMCFRTASAGKTMMQTPEGSAHTGAAF